MTKQYIVTQHGWVNIYKSPSTDSASVVRLQLNQQAELISTYNKYWYKVKFNGKTGYITSNTKYTKLITVKDTPVTPPPPVKTDKEIKQDKVVEIAKSLQGQVKYVHWQDRQEAVAPYSTDCSGYTALVYKLADIGVTLINRDDDDQAKVGTSITYGKFEKGDLLFFWNANSVDHNDVGHVGIYIGDGKMIHNASPGVDVIVSTVAPDKFIVARRVIQ
jgi:cell wall-associated NlpC family hydrolase